MSETPFDKDIDLGFTSSPCCAGVHACLIFSDDDERRRHIAAFVAAGLRDGELVSYFADVLSPEETLAWLREEAPELPRETSSTFRMPTASDAYCPDGTFSAEGMYKRLRDHHHEALELGHPVTRLTGEMTWSLRGFPGSSELYAYEEGLTEVIGSRGMTAVCQYDARAFDGATLFRMLQIHPYLIANGQMVANPSYIGDSVSRPGGPPGAQ